MSEIIADNKYVELTYQVTDEKTGDILSAVEFPLAYVHGANEVLAPQVTEELEGKTIGAVIELPIDCDEIYGPRDESLVFTDRIENVPEEYREIGMKILMENENGDPREFLVTRMDEQTLTVDGNNPLCGRQVIFTLEILAVRDATDDEIEAGGPIVEEPDFGGVPIH